MKIERKVIDGWGGSKSAPCLSAQVSNAGDCVQALEYAFSKGLKILGRGHGCSHADSSFVSNGLVLDTGSFDSIISFDDVNGILIAEPGLSFAKGLSVCMPRGWVLPCTPGGLDVTLGGAVSFDVHGKDGIKNGSFGDHVISLKLLTSSGEIKTVDKNGSDLIDYIIGGMGLFGIIVEVTVRLVRAPSILMNVTKQASSSVRHALELMESTPVVESDYSIGWMDTFSAGNSIGRGFMTSATWGQDESQFSGEEIDRLFKTKTKILGLVDSKIFWRTVRPLWRRSTVACANSLIYHVAKCMYGEGITKTTTFPSYLYIHNLIPNINLVYQPRGLVTCQPLIPRSAGHAAIEGILQRCRDNGIPSMMAGLKRRASNNRPLSFAGDGYSFSIDVPRNRFLDKDLNRKFNDLYAEIVDLGGKVYLAKDDRLPSNYFEKMYPDYVKFIEKKYTLDPELIFMSDQAKRIFRL